MCIVCLLCAILQILFMFSLTSRWLTLSSKCPCIVLSNDSSKGGNESSAQHPPQTGQKVFRKTWGNTRTRKKSYGSHGTPSLCHSPVPEQDLTSQLVVSESGPSQSFPLFLGTGISHTRVLVRVALPHVAVHMVQHDQKPHDPSIGTEVVNYG